MLLHNSQILSKSSTIRFPAPNISVQMLSNLPPSAEHQIGMTFEGETILDFRSLLIVFWRGQREFPPPWRNWHDTKHGALSKNSVMNFHSVPVGLFLQQGVCNTRSDFGAENFPGGKKGPLILLKWLHVFLTQSVNNYGTNTGKNGEYFKVLVSWEILMYSKLWFACLFMLKLYSKDDLRIIKIQYHNLKLRFF